MTQDKRKLFIHMIVTAFKTSDKKLLERHATAFTNQLNEEGIDYAIALLKEE